MAGGQGRQSIPDDRQTKRRISKNTERWLISSQDDSIRYGGIPGRLDTAKAFQYIFRYQSIVGLLVGIAYDEGFIESLDDKVSKYLPEFGEGDKITIRNLLTMSSGLDWDEAYTADFENHSGLLW